MEGRSMTDHAFEFAGRRILLGLSNIDDSDLAHLGRRFFASRPLPCFRPDERTPRLEISIPRGARPRDRRQAMASGLVSGFGQAGLVPLHAAGLVMPSSSLGVLVIGEAGAGKTTLASSLLKAGWSVASDDSLMLEPVTLQCRAFRRTIEPQIGRRPDGTRRKHSWIPALEIPERFVSHLSPGGLVFLGARAASTTMVPLSAAGALIRLLGAVGRRDHETVTALHRLTGCGPLILASCGPDVMSAPAAVSGLFMDALVAGRSGVAA
jgi:hypothetical protein